MTWFSGLLDHPLMKSFIAYSIFRAFYGAGILVVTYFVDRETAVPWWLFLAFSMVCILYTSPSPRDGLLSRMPSSA